MDPKTGSKRKHQSLTIQEKVDMLKKLDLGFSVRKLCETYGIGFSTVYDIKKQRDKILKFYENSDSKTQMCVRKTMKEGKSLEHDRRMMEWFWKWKDDGIELTGNLIKEQAKMLHEELKLEHKCDYSEGWLQRFKKRHGIVLQKIGGGGTRSANSKEEEIENNDDEEENLSTFSDLINNGEHLLNDGQVRSGESSGEIGLYERYGTRTRRNSTTIKNDEEGSDPTNPDSSKKTKNDRGGSITSKYTNSGSSGCKLSIKGKCKLKGFNTDQAGDAHEQKHKERPEKNNDDTDTQVCLYHMKTFSKSDDKKSKEEKINKEISCENLENEEIGEEKDEEEENLSLNNLIKLLGDLIKGLGQQTFVTEEELMHFYLMYEKLNREKSKRLEKLRIHEMFKKITKRLVGSRLTSSSENPVPSTSAITGGPFSGVSETNEETINKI